ncbi:MAG TPA: hypothetical protein VG816_07905 [Solirubrobacterales bacterium]|nr:hypothetical protein [Solirubrobacterales bacterium]
MIGELHTLALVLVRAEEAWEPVLFGGLIPLFGALAVGFIIWRAVRDTDEDDD